MADQKQYQFKGYASPNYTPVPDELFDEQLPDLSGAELKVLLYVIRRTFGFKRESDNISISQMLNGLRSWDGRQLDRGVGLTKKTLLLAIKSLEEKNIILTERRRSVERGDEPTSYRLNVITVQMQEKTTPPVGEKLHHGGGGDIPPGPWGKNYSTQETERETERNTDFEYSNIRQSNRSKEDFVDNSVSQPISTDDPQPVIRRGMENMAAIVARRGDTSQKQASPPVSVQQTTVADLQEPPRRGRGRPRKYSDPESQTIQNFIADFAREFADKATLNQSTARFVNDYHKWGRGDMDAFIGVLYQARSVTKAQGGVRNKFAYFADVVEDLLGLKEDQINASPPN